MGESRTELLAWLNDLLQVGYTKIEQCGTGAAHCQIIDSIYRDLPMNKVKFNSKQEYEYVANFKVLQNAFDKHKIDNAIPVERLIKCKFQDNLEFLQWMKKFWDNYFPGGTYDAVGRRGGKAADTPVRGSTQKLTTGGAVKKSTSSIAPARATRAAPRSSDMARNAEPANNNQAQLEAEYQKALQDMQQQVMEAKLTVEQVEKEREFYFLKLREIEIYVQQQIETGTHPEEGVLSHIANIMYKTEEGFEIPAGEGAEEETF
ncbi:microtubule binding protein [Powellomyces hirtus]|nr:microtubule binding protein [Powellomyces hirtus]